MPSSPKAREKGTEHSVAFLPALEVGDVALESGGVEPLIRTGNM